MAKAITVEGLSKAYQLGDFGTGTISRDVERFFARIRGKEDPYLRIGETNDRTTKGENDIVWCLKDLNFDVEEGDAVGIIGRNGAGKSTLLKVLSRITSPTTGSVKVKGRIASLLEVGTGFHPELSGRENIFLNGAILGMRKSEIKRRFDEIVVFSGVERYIDTPVKRYSSGMYVRLAFAVAAHLESEILIVDEVLAVGDAEFQKKCLGKMGDISKGEGRTVLFVSHNMASISALCSKCILLNNGAIHSIGKTTNIVDDYLNLYDNNKETIIKSNGNLTWKGLTKLYINGSDKINLIMNLGSTVRINEFFVDFSFSANGTTDSLHLRHEAYNVNGLHVEANSDFKIQLEIDACFLVAGSYKMTIYVYDKLQNVILWVENITAFEINSDSYFGELPITLSIRAPINPPFKIIKLDENSH